MNQDQAERLLQAAEAATGTRRQVLLTHVVRELADQGQLERAAAILDEVAAQQPTDLEVRVRLDLERAWLLLESDDDASAKAAATHARNAAQLSSGSLDLTPIGGLHIEAERLLARLSERPAEQVAMLKKAIALASSSKDPSAGAWRARLLIDLGRAQYLNGKVGAARLKLNEAITAAIESNDLPARDEAAEMVTWLEQNAEAES